ncbi:replication initiation protein [Ursidibacter sp. B-7004-1]
MSNDLVIVKANSLIEASYRLSIDEIRILALTIGTMDSKSDKKTFDFTVADFVREFPEVGIDNAYKQIQSAIKRIYDRSVVTENENKITHFRWVSSRTYFKKEGRFRIAMTDDVMPYLTQLKGQFTKYQLRNISSFNSVHAIRIYELCMQYKSVGEREILVDDLKKWLQVEDKYSRYNNFKQWVLEPAISEINEKSDLLIFVEPIKRGRSIYSLHFTISPKPQKAQKDKSLTKSGRPKLPQRPQVKAGTHEEGEYFRQCEKIIRTYWKEQYPNLQWAQIWNELPNSELELLFKYYKAFGDEYYYKPIQKILDKRKNT